MPNKERENCPKCGVLLVGIENGRIILPCGLQVSQSTDKYVLGTVCKFAYSEPAD